MSDLFFHGSIFVTAGVLLFVSAGILVDATDRIARRLSRSGFWVAFLLLGFLTSLSEISVAINATLEGVPQVSAGNLVGASFVIFLFIIPFLAIFGGGIRLQHALSRRHLLIALFIIASPAFFVLDGRLTRTEGVILIIFYAVLLYYTKQSLIDRTKEKVREIIVPKKKLALDIVKVLTAAILIFLSGRWLVEEAIYFSTAFGVPSSFIGLLLIALGTNIPELMIAVRAISKKHTAIAFGDYIGSAAFNTLTLGGLALLNGTFWFEQAEFVIASFFLVGGLTAFFLCARRKNDISRAEGVVLGLVYIAFLVIQLRII